MYGKTRNYGRTVFGGGIFRQSFVEFKLFEIPGTGGGCRSLKTGLKLIVIQMTAEIEGMAVGVAEHHLPRYLSSSLKIQPQYFCM